RPRRSRARQPGAQLLPPGIPHRARAVVRARLRPHRHAGADPHVLPARRELPARGPRRAGPPDPAARQPLPVVCRLRRQPPRRHFPGVDAEAGHGAGSTCVRELDRAEQRRRHVHAPAAPRRSAVRTRLCLARGRLGRRRAHRSAARGEPLRRAARARTLRRELRPAALRHGRRSLRSGRRGAERSHDRRAGAAPGARAAGRRQPSDRRGAQRRQAADSAPTPVNGFVPMERPRLRFWQMFNMSFGFFVMPTSSALWTAASLLWILDASINISMEPFRAFVADKLAVSQRTAGFVMQSFFIGVGASLANALPLVFSWMGVQGSTVGGVPLSVKYSFQVGAVVFFLAVLWTIVTTSEFPPEDPAAWDRARRGRLGLRPLVAEIVASIREMPATMRQLAVVQLFTWLGL